MRPHSIKEPSSGINKSKSKKIMEYANLISCKQQDKVKIVDKKNQILISKSNKCAKNPQNKQFSSNKQNLDEDLNYHANLNHQIKKHNRSKTQFFKPVTQNTYPDDFFENDVFAPKYDIKKKVIKKEQSQKRLKTQSCKKLHSVSQSKSNLHLIKSKQRKEKQQSLKSSCIYTKSNNGKNKIPNKNQQKSPENEHKYISSVNQELKVLKKKLKRQRSNYSSKQKNVRKSNNFQDSKNITFLNLSQILQRNEYDEQILFKNNKLQNGSQRQMKSDRSCKAKRNLNLNSHKIKQIYRNLQKRIDYMTSTITDEVCKGSKPEKLQQKSNKKYPYDGRNLSFMNLPHYPVKKGESNLSTGVDSIGGLEFKELLKLKLETQTQVSKQVQGDLNMLKDMHLLNQYEMQPQTARNFESEKTQKYLQKSSSRTFKRREEDSQNFLKQQEFNEKSMLLNLVEKYHSMTSKILPYISQAALDDFSHKQNPENQQRLLNLKPSSDVIRHNQKLMKKYTQIMEKNHRYQEIMNLLIQNGVNVEEYTAKFFQTKKLNKTK